MLPVNNTLPHPLGNFRNFPMEINKTKMNIAGVSHPCMQHKLSTADALKVLRKDYSVLISLEAHDASRITNVWERTLKGKHYIISVPDFHAPSPSQMEEINHIVTEAAKARNGGVVIHCRGGLGRTGTILSALQMRSMLEQGAKSDLRKSVELALPFDQASLKTTPLVKQAVEAIRARDTFGTSVEVEQQVHAVEIFEERLAQAPRSRL